ncbi:SMP-30/gluconolactonase/LRE family protein [Pedomonas sp. V897]|uniref:SMP-30/gluconolactonase/LRE family protein n=1 Tax=Pedomonas sp. V897 TaxID=3446482 RepID=UPI003EE0A6A4
MRGQKRGLRMVAILAMLAVTAAIAFLLPLTGWLEPLEPRTPGQCVRLAGPVGAEDFAVDWERRRAYVSSADRHAVETGGRPRGDIFLLDFSTDTPSLTPLNVGRDENFFPHGLDLFIDFTGNRRLFVIDHGADGRDHSVKVFDIGEDGRLTLARTFRSTALTSPNDIVAVSSEQFYVTNDPFDDSAWRRLAATYLALPLNTVVYHDGRTTRVAADGLRFANGITRSPDGQWLLVGESVGRSVAVYRRNPFTGELIRQGDIPVPMATDNLVLQPDGTVVAAGHPRPLAFESYARAPDQRRAPSMALRLDPAALPYPAPETPLPLPFVDDGSLFSASSVAMVDPRGRLFVGSVYERGVLMCLGASR